MGMAAVGAMIIAGGGYLTGKGPAGGLKPSTPMAPTPPPMPDVNTVRQQNLVTEAQDASARRGRASTIMTTPATTGDQLGP